ncbi:VOC family protein [Bacillus sp. NEB1478]|uniref:VOC family protein n=1 Tax=Bacillus sp. NEB1478 TaxID=3073816 RepID=UPI00287367DB|nr:VOC family protein [Bacillus sp. NEB1478]WNB91797.1 VOC family protein [Bacillus sp. NEB1478]
MIKRIATVAVYVVDQQAAKSFWTEKVGFEVKAEFPMGPDSFWLEVGPKDAQSNLVIYPKAMMKGWEEKRPSIVFETDDVQGDYDRMKSSGVEMLGEPQVMQWGTFVQFKDEDGNEFILKG